VVSDTSGVLFGQVIENIGQKVGLPSSKLTAEQMKLPRVLGVRTAGMALGVASGCFLGMISLYFLDLDKRAKEEKIQGLEPLMKSMVDSCVSIRSGARYERPHLARGTPKRSLNGAATLSLLAVQHQLIGAEHCHLWLVSAPPRLLCTVCLWMRELYRCGVRALGPPRWLGSTIT
jgi:hypothetical protein